MSKDFLILEQLMHRYDEKERQFNNVNNKLSTMIGVLVTIFIQTIFFAWLITTITMHTVALMLFLLSECLFLISAYYFIKAHNFQTVYKSVPSSDKLISINNDSTMDYDDAVREMIKQYSEGIKANEKAIDIKTSQGQRGFNLLYAGAITSFLLMVSLIVFP